MGASAPSRQTMKAITIVGKGREWEGALNVSGNGSDVMGITQINLRLPVDMVIDMNDYSLWGEEEEKWAEDSKKIAELNNTPYIDRSNYPYQEIVNEFGIDYFTSTVAYAMAYAIFKGYEQINLYGVPLEHHTEYAHQRPCVEYWIGIARGRGIEVNIYGKFSTLLRSIDGKIYGYGTPQSWKAREI